MAFMLIVCATICLIVPAIANIALGTAVTILTGAEYVSLCTIIYGIYVGGNVSNKYAYRKNLSEPPAGHVDEGSQNE